MTYLEKYQEETKRNPYCWNAKGEYISSASFTDDYVKWLEKQIVNINNFYCNDEVQHKTLKCSMQCSDCMDYMENTRFKTI